MADEDSGKTARDMLVWCRANGFRATRVRVRELELAVDDLRTNVSVEPQGPVALTVHDAWAKKFGVPMPDQFDDEDDESVPS